MMYDVILYIDAILPPQGHWIEDSKKIGPETQEKALGFHELSMSPLIFVHIRLGFHYFWALYLGLHNVGRVP